MKIMITMMLSASFIAASSGTTAEEGLMKAIGKIDRSPKPLISVASANRSTSSISHIRELHGDIHVMQSPPKRKQRLATFKARLKKQARDRRLGLSQTKLPSAY